jgi:plastocyanin
MMRRMTALSILVLLAAGCGEPDTLPEDDANLPEVPSLEPAPADQTALPPDEGDLRNVEATLTEWSVTLSQDSVAAGAIAFNVRNSGSVVHRFEVEGNGEEWETDDLNPGDTVTMSVSLEPGVYEVYCPVEEDGMTHQERGMTTTLRVY